MTVGDVLASLEAAKTLGRRVAYVVVAAAGLVLAGYCAGVRTRGEHLDRTLVRQQATYTKDAATHAAAVARTDSTLASAAPHIAAAVHADSGWADAKRLAATMPTLIASHATDAAKILALVAINDTLIRRGNALQASNDSLRADLTRIRASVFDERATAAKQLADAAAMLTTSEAETAAARRHWGLGCGVGPTVIVYPTPQAGLGVSCGLTYRR